jgi:hypothetical protein
MGIDTVVPQPGEDFISRLPPIIEGYVMSLKEKGRSQLYLVSMDNL